MMQISPRRVVHVIVRAREIDAKVGTWDRVGDTADAEFRLREVLQRVVIAVVEHGAGDRGRRLEVEGVRLEVDAGAIPPESAVHHEPRHRPPITRLRTPRRPTP